MTIPALYPGTWLAAALTLGTGLTVWPPSNSIPTNPFG